MKKVTAFPDKLFGQIVISKHLARVEHVEECLGLQAQWSDAGGQVPALGEILVQRGYITPAQLNMVLAEQKRRAGPRRFGSYELLSKIGEGGMGMVYRARHVESNELVALKLISKRVAKDQAVRERFMREANVGMKLDHPNIVATKDAGEVHGILYLALELIQGGSLSDRLENKYIYSELEALQMTQDIALALEYAHGKGLVHRDIKPDNILFDSTFAVKLSDFGLVKMTDPQSANLTHSGITVGTPHYISPEQARGESDIDIRADIYSLGATLYRLVTGDTPFQGSSPLIVMTKHLGEQLRPPDELNAELSEGCVALIEKMMAKDRNDRYESPMHLIRDIDRVIGGKKPVAAPLSASKSSVGRSAVRGREAKNHRRSSRRVPVAKVRGKNLTTGLRQTGLRRQRKGDGPAPARYKSKTGNGLLSVAAVIVLIVGAWAMAGRGRDPSATAYSEPKKRRDAPARQTPGEVNENKNVKVKKPAGKEEAPKKVATIVIGKPAAQRLDIPAGAVKWTGGGGDGKWSTAANWEGRKLPDKKTVVAFADTSGACVIDENAKIAGLYLDNTFKGKLALGSGVQLSVGQKGFHLSGGLFQGGDGEIEASGGLAVQGGTFVSTSGTLKVTLSLKVSGGLFHHGSGTVSVWHLSTLVASGPAEFNDVVLDTMGNLTVEGSMRVGRNLLIKKVNGFGGGPLEVRGNVTTTVLRNSTMKSQIVLNGSGDQKIKAEGGVLPSIIIRKTQGRVLLEGELHIKGSWTLAAGTVEAGSSTVVFRDFQHRIDASRMFFHNVIVRTNGNFVVVNEMNVRNDFRVESVNVLFGGHILVGGKIEKAGPAKKYKAPIISKKDWPQR